MGLLLIGTNLYAEYLYVDGNVGIGTTKSGTYQYVPSKLEVKGSAHTGIAINTADETKVSDLNLVIKDIPQWEFQARGTTDFPNNRLSIFNGASAETVSILQNGYVGIGTTNPGFPLQMGGSGAYVSTGGVWTNASSRDYKENIKNLSTESAFEALARLTPVTYNYKVDANEKHVGFIAEDAPDIVASKDRKGLSPMDIVAVLTRVVQEQQKKIDQLSNEIEKMNGTFYGLNKNVE